MSSDIYVPPGISVLESEQLVMFVGPFRVDIKPVTKLEYLRYLLATGQKPQSHFYYKHKEWKPADGSTTDPITGVSWFQAGQYAKWTGKRLPTWVELFRAARGFDERGWINGAPCNVFTIYNNKKQHSFGKAPSLSELAPSECSQIIHKIKAGEKTSISNYTLSNNARSQIHFAAQYEWVDKSLEETVDELETMLLIPQALRYSNYYQSYFGRVEGKYDSRKQDFETGKVIPHFDYKEVKRAFREVCSLSIKELEESRDINKPLFNPKVFLGDNYECINGRRNLDLITEQYDGDASWNSIGFRCVNDAPTCLSPQA